jgi:hypothetical protein
MVTVLSGTEKFESEILVPPEFCLHLKLFILYITNVKFFPNFQLSFLFQIFRLYFLFFKIQLTFFSLIGYLKIDTLKKSHSFCFIKTARSLIIYTTLQGISG